MKYLSFLLVPLMLFAFTGCGEDETPLDEDIVEETYEVAEEVDYAEPDMNGPEELIPEVEGPTEDAPVEIF